MGATGVPEPRAALLTRAWRDQVRTTLAQAGTKLGRTGWYRIVDHAPDAADADTAQLWVYDEIGMWGQSAADFVRELGQVTASRIDCHINSPGGEVFDGIAIYNALKSHPAEVTVTVDSLAASIASVIAMAGDRVLMAQGAQMMIHDAQGLCFGAAADMREMGDLLDRQSDNIAGFYAARAGGRKADWRAAMGAETWYTAAEAVAAGLADEAMTGKPKAKAPAGAAMESSWDLSMFRYAGRPAAPPPAPVDRQPSPAPAGRAFPTDHASAEPVAPQDPADGPAWTDELAAAFTAAMRDDPDDAAVVALRAAGLRPEPVPTEPDVLIDPIEFYNAVREGTRP